MERSEIERLIDEKILEHERRIGRGLVALQEPFSLPLFFFFAGELT
jgi:hypothetical protein